MGNIFIVLLFYIVCVNVANLTSVNECKQGALPDEVNISNCTKPPCIFHHDTTVTLAMKFRSPCYLEKMAPKAIARIANIEIPYPLDQKDACDGITNTPCPIAKGEKVEYQYGMYLSPLFPSISATLDFSIMDLEQNKAIQCFSVDFQLV